MVTDLHRSNGLLVISLLFTHLFCLLPERMFSLVLAGEAQALLITFTMSLSSSSSVSVSHYSVTVSQCARYQDPKSAALQFKFSCR